MPYIVKINCGNCCTSRKYNIERGISVSDANLICPNCGCCPTDQDYVIITPKKSYGSAKHKSESEETDAD